MSKIKNILVAIHLLILVASCIDVTKNNEVIGCVEKIDSINLKLNQYFNSNLDFIELLTKREKDSIVKLWCESDTILSSFQFFFNEIVNRELEIKRLKASTQDIIFGKSENVIPTSFSRFILQEELKGFNMDSMQHLVKFNELMKYRRKKVRTIMNGSRYSGFLLDSDIQTLLKGSFKDSIYYRELALARYKEHSIALATRRNKRIDSLQKIIYPINFTLPFGPASLGEMLQEGKTSVAFTHEWKVPLPQDKRKDRKVIHNIWTYFLNLHPNADEDLVEGFEEKLLPPIKTFHFVDLGITISNKDQKIDPNYCSFEVRLSNVGKYEVYYATTGSDYPISCSVHAKTEENCCFGEEYYCTSTGYLIFYDRKKQNSIVIPAFIMKSDGQGYNLRLQYFYIEENTVHIYEGSSFREKDNGSNYFYDRETVSLSKTHEIKIQSNGDVIVNELCVLEDHYNSEKNSP